MVINNRSHCNSYRIIYICLSVQPYKTCKRTLGVKKSSTNLAVRAELGRLPLEYFTKTHFLISSQT